MYLLNENLLKYSAFTMIVGTTANVVLNYLLIPVYMGVGAAIATLSSFFITIFLIDWFYAGTKDNSRMILRSLLTCGSILKKRSWLF